MYRLIHRNFNSLIFEQRLKKNILMEIHSSEEISDRENLKEKMQYEDHSVDC